MSFQGFNQSRERDFKIMCNFALLLASKLAKLTEDLSSSFFIMKMKLRTNLKTKRQVGHT